MWVPSTQPCCAPACGGGGSSQASQSAQGEKQLQQLLKKAFLLAEHFGWILLCLPAAGQEEGGCSGSMGQGHQGLGFSSVGSARPAAEFSLITGMLESSQQPVEPFLCLFPRG